MYLYSIGAEYVYFNKMKYPSLKEYHQFPLSKTFCKDKDLCIALGSKMVIMTNYFLTVEKKSSVYHYIRKLLDNHGI